MKKFIYVTLFALLLSVPFFAERAEAQTCSASQECGWVTVSDVTQFGIAPSLSAQGFYNTQATKDKLCQMRGYESNPGYEWAVNQSAWDNCNAEFHIDWRNGWDIHKCGGLHYLSSIYCVRPKPVLPAPSVNISVNPEVVQWGSDTEITWSSQNVTSCEASGSWSGAKSASGSETSSRFWLGGKTFTITCQGTNGESATDSASASMDIIPSAPSVTWSSFPSSPIASGAPYLVEVTATDRDGDLSSVTIEKGSSFVATANGGDGRTSSASYNSPGDTGPTTVTFTATAIDGRGDPTTVTRQLQISAPVVPPSGSPTIAFTSCPSVVEVGQQYTITAMGSDVDGDLGAVKIDEGNTPFAYAPMDATPPMDNLAGTSGNPATKNSAQTVRYKAWAEDHAGNRSSDVWCSVVISPSDVPISASVSVTPSCVAPGRSISVQGSAVGTGITSNVLEKDTNGDNSFGSISSRTDAGNTSSTVSVPSNETSNRYDFRVNVNNGAVVSAVRSVSISNNCGGGTSASSASSAGGASSSSGGTNPDGSLEGSSCVIPGGTITIRSYVKDNGDGVDSKILEKDTNGDDQYGIAANWGSGDGRDTHTESVPASYTGTYRYRLIVNGEWMDSRDVTVSSTCGGGTSATSASSASSAGGSSSGGGGSSCTASWNFSDLTGYTCYSGVMQNNANGNLMPLSGSRTVPAQPSSYIAFCSHPSLPVVQRTIYVNCPPPPIRCTDPNAFNYNADAACVYSSFTLSASPNPVKAKSFSGFSGVTEQDIKFSVNPVYGFNAPVSLRVSSYPTELSPEFSYDGGQTWTTSPDFSGSISLPYFARATLRVRFGKKLETNRTYSITVTGTAGSGRGAGKTANASVSIDSKPLFPGYWEQ